MNTSHSPQSNEQEVVNLSSQERGTVMDAQGTHDKQVEAVKPNLENRLRALAADATNFEGKTMERWDQIRGQVERLLGSDLPRLNFEGLMEDFAEPLREAAAELSRLRAEREKMVATLQKCWGGLNFILAFYEPGQRYLDTNAWKIAEADGRAARDEAASLLSQVSP